LTPERLDLLNSLGFVWDSHEVNWAEKYQALVEYKKEKGDCNVPSNYVHKKLATWVKVSAAQRKLNLSTEKLTFILTQYLYDVFFIFHNSANADNTNCIVMDGVPL
jgi:hypothetical protein